MKTFLLSVFLGGLAVAVVIVGVVAWRSAGEAEISLLGWLAMGVGVLATIFVGVGLMALVFYSSRHGHDDNQYRSSHEEDENERNG